jgi:hypothetical protein
VDLACAVVSGMPGIYTENGVEFRSLQFRSEMAKAKAKAKTKASFFLLTTRISVTDYERIWFC